MKRVLILFALLCIILINAKSQNSPFRGFFNDITPQLVTDNAKSPIKGALLIRLDVGLVSPAFGFKVDESGAIAGIEPRVFSKTFAGLIFTHVKPSGTRDWGAGLGITAPNSEGRYGAALVGGYSVFKLGLNYDFGLSAAEGLSFLAGITVDLFNLTE